MSGRAFSTHDTGLYATWHYERGGIVEIVVPGQPSVVMSLAKAEDLGHSLLRQAEYGRAAAVPSREEEK